MMSSKSSNTSASTLDLPTTALLNLSKKVELDFSRPLSKVAFLSDTRVSGVSHGAIGVHCAPEAAVGGPIALIKDGDRITIDGDKGILSVDVTEEEFSKRKASWKPRGTDYNSGTLWKYSQTVGSAQKGAITHPGADEETHIYADI